MTEQQAEKTVTAPQTTPVSESSESKPAKHGGKRPGPSGKPNLRVMANGDTITLDKSTLQRIAPDTVQIPKSPSGAAATPSTAKMPAVTLDKSTLTPINPGPQYTLDRTLMNMTRAMSGQKMDNPEDQAMAEKGKREGFESAATTAALSLGSELLFAPRAVQVLSKVPAGRDPVTGRILPWVTEAASEEGPSLAKEGFAALKAAGEAHPLGSK